MNLKTCEPVHYFNPISALLMCFTFTEIIEGMHTAWSQTESRFVYLKVGQRVSYRILTETYC